MTFTPKVTVCVVTYNHERYIRDCLMSVIAQSSDVALEILVGDDHSDDATAEIIKSLAEVYPELIRYLRPDKRFGWGSINYQFLISQARGEFIAHLDGDDYWLPGKLKKQTEFLAQHPDCSAVYTNALTIHDQGTVRGVFNNQQPAVFDINYLLRRGNFLNHSSILYRSELKHDLLAMQAPFLDYRIHLAFACHGHLGYLNQILTVYRVSSDGSVLVRANDYLRELYLVSLQAVPLDRVHARDVGMGMAELMRAVFFRAARVRSLSLILKWWPKILDEAPVGCMKMLLWAFLSIVRTGSYDLMNIFCAKVGGIQMKVLYRR